MIYRSQINRDEKYIKDNCIGNCNQCPIVDFCYQHDSIYEGQDVIEDE